MDAVSITSLFSAIYGRPFSLSLGFYAMAEAASAGTPGGPAAQSDDIRAWDGVSTENSPKS